MGLHTKSPGIMPTSATNSFCSYDEALALFLICLASQVKESFYIKAVKFVLLYRDCFLSLQEASSAKLRHKATLRAAGNEQQNEDSALLSDELPGICNEFVVNYLPQFSK